MGATLVQGGATFRVWAPHAHDVYVVFEFNGDQVDESGRLTRDERGYFRGFVPGVRDRQRYLYWVIGDGSIGFKRDPYARELDASAGLWRSVVRQSDYPWHDAEFVPPPFSDFVIYQLHVGVFHAPRWPRRGGTFLDVIEKLDHLVELGITALQLLPIQEFPTLFSLGYNGTDYFSPEGDFAVPDMELGPYLLAVNERLAAFGFSPLRSEDLHGEMNQCKALVDLCHLYGIAVIFDVVYNHAGGDFGDQSLYFFDRQRTSGGHWNSLYFSDRGPAGGLVFDFGKAEVREFLIQNAKFLLDEFHVDGFRYDQVSVIDHDGAPHGWSFCQDLTETLHFHQPSALQLAEYWPVNPYIVKPVPEGAGFDSSLTDGLRIAIRRVIEAASHPDDRPLDMTGLGRALWPEGFGEGFRFVQGPENHDLVYVGREQRVARLGQPNDPRSWYARSRARVATGISLTAPGIPMMFMGQEFLEDKPWSDNLDQGSELLLHWDGLEQGDKQVHDHLRFVRELVALRGREPALRGNGLRVLNVHDENRVLVFQRWVEGQARDVFVVVHLAPFHRFDYRIGVPLPGFWHERFNSDVYEQWVNPSVVGNGTGVWADPIPLHECDFSVSLSLPANSILVFGR